MPVLLHLLALAVFAQGTSEFVLAGILPGIAADLDVPLDQAGLLTSGFALGMVIGAPLMAAAARRVSPRWSLTTFLALFIVAHVVGAITDSFAVLLATRIAAALAHAGFLAVTLATVTRLVPAAQHTRALAVILGGTTLALIAGVPAGALVGESLGWRSTIGSIALLCVPALVAVCLAAPSDPAPADATRAVGSVRRELATLREPSLRGFLLLAVLVNAATFCTFTYLAVIAAGPAGVPDRLAPALLAVFGAGAFVGVIVAGRLGDRHWRRLLGVTSLVLLAGWVMLALTVDVEWLVWAFVFVQGALSFALGSTLIARVLAAARAAPTLGGSFATVALNIGAVLGPLIGGLAIDTRGERAPIWASALLVAVAAITWFLWREGSRSARPAARL